MKEDGKISNGSKGERLERDLDKKMLKTKIEILEGIRIRRSRRRRRRKTRKVCCFQTFLVMTKNSGSKTKWSMLFNCSLNILYEILFDWY